MKPPHVLPLPGNSTREGSFYEEQQASAATPGIEISYQPDRRTEPAPVGAALVALPFLLKDL